MTDQFDYIHFYSEEKAVVISEERDRPRLSKKMNVSVLSRTRTVNDYS